MNIFYVTPFKFPDNSAMSRRIYNNILAFGNAGHNMYVCSGAAASQCQADYGLPSLLKGVEYVNEFGFPDKSKLYKAFNLFCYGGKTLRWLKNQKNKIDMIIQYGGYTPLTIRLLRFCKEQNIPLVIEVLDWFEAFHYWGRWGNLFYINSEIAIRHFFPLAGNIYTISLYMKSYYESKGCKVLSVPPMIDMKTIAPNLSYEQKDKLTISYTGMPGKKDLLDPIIETLIHEDIYGERINFRIVGPSERDVLSYPSLRSRSIRKIPNCINVTGRMTTTEAMEIARQSDFTVLLRPPMRYAMAGFPTKVTESLAVGTPVICTLTSDLSTHIQDGHEGLVCKTHSSEDFRNALTRAMKLNQFEHQRMRQSARLRAEQSFDYRSHIGLISNFLDKVCSH